MVEIQKLSKHDLRRMLLDAVTDAELATLIDNLEDVHASLSARLLTAPADVDTRAQEMSVGVSVSELRDEQARRAGLTASQRRAEEVARKG